MLPLRGCSGGDSVDGGLLRMLLGEVGLCWVCAVVVGAEELVEIFFSDRSREDGVLRVFEGDCSNW